MINLNLLMCVGKVILSIFILNVFWVILVLVVDNMCFYGVLVVEFCMICLGDDVISLNFGIVVDKYLYLN